MPKVPDSLSTPAAAPAKARKGKAPKKLITLPPMKSAIITGMNDLFVKDKSLIRTATMADAKYLPEVTRWVLTHIYELDLLLSRGRGIPCGRFIEISGNEGAGKSALAEYLMSIYHKRLKSPPHLLPYEYDNDTAHLESYGMTLSDVELAEGIESIEDGWNYLNTLLTVLTARRREAIKRKLPLDPPSLAVWDSIAQSPSRAELEEDDHGDSHVGQAARAFSKAFRKHTRTVALNDLTVIFVNQVRDKIAKGGFAKGPQTDTPGGRAVKFACSIRLAMWRMETIKRRGQPSGMILKVVSKKCKHGPYPMEASLILSFTHGIDPARSNFGWFQRNRIIVPNGKKGFLWASLPTSQESFKPSEFGEWAKAHKTEVRAARDELYEDILSSGRPDADVTEETDEAEGRP